MDSLNESCGDDTPVTSNQSNNESPPEHSSTVDTSPSGFIAGTEGMLSPVSHVSKNVRINTSAINVGDTSTNFSIQDSTHLSQTQQDYWMRKAAPTFARAHHQQSTPVSQPDAGNHGTTNYFKNAINGPCTLYLCSPSSLSSFPISKLNTMALSYRG